MTPGRDIVSAANKKPGARPGFLPFGLFVEADQYLARTGAGAAQLK